MLLVDCLTHSSNIPLPLALLRRFFFSDLEQKPHVAPIKQQTVKKIQIKKTFFFLPFFFSCIFHEIKRNFFSVNVSIQRHENDSLSLILHLSIHSRLFTSLFLGLFYWFPFSQHSWTWAWLFQLTRLGMVTMWIGWLTASSQAKL